MRQRWDDEMAAGRCSEQPLTAEALMRLQPLNPFVRLEITPLSIRDALGAAPETTL